MAAQKFLNTQALNGIDAVITGDAKVKNSSGKLASSGTIRMENARIHNLDVGYPIVLDYDFADDLTTDIIQVHKGNLKLGSTPITIAGSIDTRPTPAQIDLRLTAGNASIAEAARLASAFGVAFGPGMDVKGQVTADIQARGAMDKPGHEWASLRPQPGYQRQGAAAAGAGKRDLTHAYAGDDSLQ